MIYRLLPSNWGVLSVTVSIWHQLTLIKSTFNSVSGSKDIDVGSSCSSLKQSGHFISGYYNIKQEEVRKVVFCDMGSGSYGEVPQSDELDLSTRGTWCGRSEVILKKSSNLYCRMDLGRVLMVETKVSKGFFV